MATSVAIYETADSRSPGSAGFALEGGRAQYTFQVAAQALQEAVADILGSVKARGDGRLARVLPMPHPQFPWLRAERVSNIQGLGQATPANSGAGGPADNFLDQYLLYPTYHLTVEFLPPRHDVVKDASVRVGNVTWTDLGGGSVTTKTTSEWQRWTDWEYAVNPELVTAQQGQSFLVRDTSSITAPDPAKAPHGFQFAGQPRIYVPRATLKIHWLNVPYAYYSSPNSFFVRYAGRVNQLAFAGYNPGEVLYLGATAKRYTPPFPLQGQAIDNGGPTGATKNCDIEIHCEIHRRPAQVGPGDSGNNVYRGANAMPWFGGADPNKLRGFYATVTPAVPNPGDNQAARDATTNTSANWAPTYASFPIEILFTDPNA